MNPAIEPGSMKLYRCFSCPKRYSRAFSLRDHQRIHTGEKPYTCSNATCDRTFVSKDLCRTHEATHCQDRKHTCAKCGKKFLRSCTLRRHERQVHAWHKAKKRDEHIEGSAASSEQEFRHPPNNFHSQPTLELLSDNNHAIPQTEYPQLDWSVNSNPLMQAMPTQSMANSTYNSAVPKEISLPPKEPSYDCTRSAICGETSWPDLVAKGPYSSTWYHMAWFIAAQEGQAPVLQQLHLEYGVNIEATNRSLFHFGLTALGISALRGHHDAFKVLLDLGANANSREVLTNSTPLHQAIYGESNQCVAMLLLMGGDVDLKITDGSTVLMAAVRRAVDIATFRTLLKYTRSIDEKNSCGKALVHIAAESLDCSYLALVLDHGANWDARTRSGKSILHLASQLGKSENIRVILEKADLLKARNKRQQTALHYLGRRADMKEEDQDIKISLHLMLTRGADINALDDEGNTPLMAWVSNGYIPDKEIIITHGADVNIINNHEETALDIALEKLDDLMQDLKDDEDDRPFWISRMQRQTKTVAILIDLEAKTERDLRIEDSDAYSNLSEVESDADE